jgi:predicted ferric reductase
MAHQAALSWLVARASGVTAYVLLTISVCAGIMMSGRVFRENLRNASIMETHRYVSLLGMVFIGVHVVALTLDKVAPVPLLAVFVPGEATFRPLWTSAGVVAAELWVAIHLSFRIRPRIGVPAWRAIHYLTFLVFALATVHSLYVGTDSNQLWMTWMVEGSVALVAGATTWRFVHGRG